jgi:hypothetical protein
MDIRKVGVAITIVGTFCYFTALLIPLLYSSHKVIPQENVISQPSIDVKITSFNITGYDNPVGIAWNDEFQLNYLNNGTVDVHNVTIAFYTNSPYAMHREISIFDPTPPHYCIGGVEMGKSYPLDVIRAGETKVFCGEIWNSILDAAKIRGYAFLVIIKSNDTVLDQAMTIL